MERFASPHAFRRGLVHEPDTSLLLSVAALLLIGFVLLISAGAPIGYERFGDSYFFAKRQLLFGLLPGLVLFFLFAKVSYHRLLFVSGVIFLGTIGLLLLVFLPGIGSTLNTGARSWLAIGSQTIQPAEFMKLAMILFLSVRIAKTPDAFRTPKGFLSVLALGALPILLVLLQPDIGTALVLFCILFGVLFLGGARFSHLSAVAALGVLAFGILIAVAPYRAARLTTFLHPELDPQGIGYHINQASLAIGSGGWWGLGLGHSRQKFQYLPEVHGDSIFAVLAEEMGFLFSLCFLALFCFLAYRMIRISSRADDLQGLLIVGGVVIWILTQTFFNIGSMVGLLPITGLPLPFVSHGGTALLVLLATMGVVVNVSKYTL